jgi:hypothetical protein
MKMKFFICLFNNYFHGKNKKKAERTRRINELSTKKRKDARRAKVLLMNVNFFHYSNILSCYYYYYYV